MNKDHQKQYIKGVVYVGDIEKQVLTSPHTGYKHSRKAQNMIRKRHSDYIHDKTLSNWVSRVHVKENIPNNPELCNSNNIQGPIRKNMEESLLVKESCIDLCHENLSNSQESWNKDSESVSLLSEGQQNDIPGSRVKDSFFMQSQPEA